MPLVRVDRVEYGPHSHHCSSVGGLTEVKRMRSGRPVASTLMTSAPSAPSVWGAMGPAHQAVQSRTRIPAQWQSVHRCRHRSGRRGRRPVRRTGGATAGEKHHRTVGAAPQGSRWGASVVLADPVGHSGSQVGCRSGRGEDRLARRNGSNSKHRAAVQDGTGRGSGNTPQRSRGPRRWCGRWSTAWTIALELGPSGRVVGVHSHLDVVEELGVVDHHEEVAELAPRCWW